MRRIKAAWRALCNPEPRWTLVANDPGSAAAIERMLIQLRRQRGQSTRPNPCTHPKCQRENGPGKR